MVRVGGLDYSIDPNVSKGKRITDMELNGKKRMANKKYKVAGWAVCLRKPTGNQYGMWYLII